MAFARFAAAGGGAGGYGLVDKAAQGLKASGEHSDNCSGGSEDDSCKPGQGVQLVTEAKSGMPVFVEPRVGPTDGTIAKTE